MGTIIPARCFDEPQFILRAADAPLNRWVQCVWSSRLHPAALPMVDNCYPDGGSSLTFDYSTGAAEITVSLNRSVSKIPLQQLQNAVSVRFSPGGLNQLLGLAMEQLSDESLVPINSLKLPLYDSILRLAENLHHDSSSDRIHRLLSWLQRAFQTTTAHEPAYGLIRHLNKPWPVSAMTTSITTVAEELGVSRRTLERRSRQLVGMAPAEWLKNNRMTAARRCLSASSQHHSITEIAAMCGYFDHAHFCHDFKALCRETPTAYRHRKMSQTYKPS